MPGDANALESTSKPSSPFSPIVIATAITCSTLMGAAEIVARGSVVVLTEQFL